MKVPTFTPTKIAENDGTPSASFHQFMDVMTAQMQTHLSDDGHVLPAQSTTTIQQIINPANPNAKPPGTIWYDSTLHKYVGNENGTLVAFTATPV
jgi:hypothetical protein